MLQSLLYCSTISIIILFSYPKSYLDIFLVFRLRPRQNQRLFLNFLPMVLIKFGPKIIHSLQDDDKDSVAVVSPTVRATKKKH